MTAIAGEQELQQLLAAVAALRGDAPGAANLAVLENSIALGEMSPLHVHEEDEAFHVLQGSIVVYAGGEPVRLEVGHAFVAPRGVPHAYRGDSDHTRYLTVTFARSVGRYQDFLRAVARPEDASAADGGDESTVAAIAEANDISVLGPPGALPAGL